MNIEVLQRAVAGRDPLAARLVEHNHRTGRQFGTAVQQGEFYASETVGRETTLFGRPFQTRADCIAFIEEHV